MCSLVLPPPLLSLFDNSNSSSGAASGANNYNNNDVTTASATRPTTATTTSDNISIDGSTLLKKKHSSNVSLISASVVSTAGSTSVHNNKNKHLPLNLRVGMSPCDPILVFNGNFALVATCDGRIAIYSIADFDIANGISEDVLASERRRRAEWEEEDMNIMDRINKEEEEEEKKDTVNNSYEEENEWDIRSRMRQREKAKQRVEPILIVTLPSKKDDQTYSQDEESTTMSSVAIVSPPTIVSMCATPVGVSLIEKRDVHIRHMGHVAVLTGDGEVYILEFLYPLSFDNLQEEEERSERSSIDAKGSSGNMKQAPVVRTTSFNTGYLGATCICIHQTPTSLCIGHQSGIVTTFKLSCETSISKLDSPTKQGHERRHTHGSPDQFKRSKSNDFGSKLNTQSKTAPRGVFQRVDSSLDKGRRTIPIHRTLSEPTADKSLEPIAKVLLCWKGTFNVPIRSLSSPGWGSMDNDDNSIRGVLLVIGLEQRQRKDSARPMSEMRPPPQHYSLSPVISLEVINTTLAEELYDNIKSRGDECIPLCDCIVWPASGMEIKDGWIRAGLRGVNPRDKLFEILQRTSVTSKICECICDHVLSDLISYSTTYSLYDTNFQAVSKDRNLVLLQLAQMGLLLFHIAIQNCHGVSWIQVINSCSFRSALDWVR